MLFYPSSFTLPLLKFTSSIVAVQELDIDLSDLSLDYFRIIWICLPAPPLFLLIYIQSTNFNMLIIFLFTSSYFWPLSYSHLLLFCSSSFFVLVSFIWFLKLQLKCTFFSEDFLQPIPHVEVDLSLLHNTKALSLNLLLFGKWRLFYNTVCVFWGQVLVLSSIVMRNTNNFLSQICHFPQLRIGFYTFSPWYCMKFYDCFKQ